MPQFPDIGWNSDRGISNFWISVQSYIKETNYNSRTNNNIDMKVGPVTKLDKRNTETAKKIDDNYISVNINGIVFFPIYGQFGTI